MVGYPEGQYSVNSLEGKIATIEFQPNKQWQFFWDYQIRKMYNRYFLWQFVGRGSASDPTVISMGANRREDGVDLSQFGLPTKPLCEVS